MGDIDFLIWEEDRQRTHEALLQLDFSVHPIRGLCGAMKKEILF